MFNVKIAVITPVTEWYSYNDKDSTPDVVLVGNGSFGSTKAGEMENNHFVGTSKLRFT